MCVCVCVMCAYVRGSSLGQKTRCEPGLMCGKLRSLSKSNLGHVHYYGSIGLFLPNLQEGELIWYILYLPRCIWVCLQN